MSVIYSAGVATAYGAAVRGGYTGTYAEFCTALGDLANVLEDFESFSVAVSTLPAGSTATASYSNGVLSLGIPKGDKGDKGDTGDQGPIGVTPDFTIGTVQTLAAGSDATASITGTDEDPVLNLGIPKGDPGEVPAAALASDFSASVSYKKGDYVWRSGTLYEFTADHAVGAWTGTDATAAKVADDVADLKSATAQIANTLITETASGSVVTFDDGADGVDSKGYVLSIEPHQEGSGDPSPTNVRPITGWTAATVQRWGKNLVKENITLPQTSNGVTFDSPSPGVISVDGTADATIGANVLQAEIVKGAKYTISVSPASVLNDNFYINIQAFKGTTFISNPATLKNSALSYTFTADGTINRIAFRPTVTSGTQVSNAKINVQAEVGNSATAWEAPVTPLVREIEFPVGAGTVYGGTLVKNADGTGTLTASWAILTANGTETYWRRGTTQNSYYYDLHLRKHALNTIFACSHAKMISNTTEYRNTEWSAFTGEANNGIPAYIHPSDDIQTVDAFKAFLAEQSANGTPVQWAYELATPTTYTIPAEDMAKIPTLLGDNTVWMSADGSISLDYRADTKMYIDKLIGGIRGNIAYIEDSLTASRTYTAGQYVMVSGTLYKVQSNIASGATFTPGTNIIATTVGTELTAVNA